MRHRRLAHLARGTPHRRSAPGEPRPRRRATDARALRANPRANWRKRKNDNRASAFAALLVREFGRDRLRAGAVVDVAGGSGELAFELAARWGIPCTIIDPRGEGVRVTARHRRLLASRAANAALGASRVIAFTHCVATLLAIGRRSIPRERPTSNVLSTRPRWTIQNSPRSSWSVPRSSGSTRTRPRARRRRRGLDVGINRGRRCRVACFPGSFPERKAPTTGRTARTTEELVEHLAARMANGRARREVLHFDGANVAVWCDAEPGRGRRRSDEQIFRGRRRPAERACRRRTLPTQKETRARASAADDA